MHLLTRRGHEGELLEALEREDLTAVTPHFVGREAGVASISPAGQLGRYRRWLHDAAEAAERIATSRTLVHHVTWGSVWWGSEYPRLGLPYIHGPVGGGQTVPPSLRPLLQDAKHGEAVRTVLVRHARLLMRRAARLAREADHLLVTNPETHRVLTALGARSVSYMLAEAVTEDMIAVGRAGPPSVPTYLWVGHMRGIKAPQLAVRAFGKVVRELPEARLLMVGDGPLLNTCREEASRLGVASRVDFTGWLNWTQVQALYAEATALLFTSIRDSSGAQCLEAAAAGTPLVVIDHQGVGHFTPSDAACKIPVADVRSLTEAFAAAMFQIATEPRTWASMSDSCTQHAKAHTWGRHAVQAEQIYRQLSRSA